jgi:hypothetical protein
MKRSAESIRKQKAAWAAKRKDKQAKQNQQEIPLDLIPQRLPPIRVTTRPRDKPDVRVLDVFAEYDLDADSLMLVMGTTKMPLRVKR